MFAIDQFFHHEPAPMSFGDFVNETFRRLAKQGQPAGRLAANYANGMQCLYRGPGGTKCAIGMWIDDAAYAPRFEGHRIQTVIDILPRWIRAFDILDLADLQALHDNADPWRSPDKMWQTMQTFAGARNIHIDPSIRDLLQSNWKGIVLPKRPVHDHNAISYNPGLFVTHQGTYNIATDHFDWVSPASVISKTKALIDA